MDSESILNSILGMVGDRPEAPAFKDEVMIHINSVFSILRRLGVGPSEGFYITGTEETWEDFMDEDPKLAMVKSYMFMKVKLIFDPPASATVLESYKRLIDEFEWSANFAVEVDPENTE